jgi:hypothetical protein
MTRLLMLLGRASWPLLVLLGLLLTSACSVADDDDATADDDDATADDDDATADDDDATTDDDDATADDDDATTDDDDATADDDATTDDDDATADDDDATTSVDADGDGWYPPADCDDTDAVTFPGAQELCDGADNDCDGSAEDSASPLCTCFASLSGFTPESGTAMCWGILSATTAETEQGWPAAVASALNSVGDGACPAFAYLYTPLPGACIWGDRG